MDPLQARFPLRSLLPDNTHKEGVPVHHKGSSPINSVDVSPGNHHLYSVEVLQDWQ